MQSIMLNDIINIVKNIQNDIDNLEKYVLTGEECFAERQNELYKQLNTCYKYILNEYGEDYGNEIIAFLQK